MLSHLSAVTMMKKAQLVFVPATGISHLMSAVEFAKLLINRDPRLSIALMVIKSPFDTKTAAYTESLTSSYFSDRIRVINLPECPNLSQSDRGSLMNTLIEIQKPHIKEVVCNLTRSHSAPPLAAFIIDMFCTAMIDVAKEFGVPALVFYTSGVAFLGLMLHLHKLRDRDNFVAYELDGSDTEFAVPSYANPVPSRVLPSFVLFKQWDPFFLTYASRLKQADGFIVNSVEELESHAVHSFSDGAIPLYPVGPILNLDSDSDTDKQGSECDSEIIKWLDDQPPSSVVFLCFGSMGWFGEDQFKEIARALEDSGARFLWSLRKPPPKGSMGMPCDYSLPELAEVLPGGFLDRTAGIGRVISWAPQGQVLAHQATGGFVSHCGWNSTLESIHFGVPIATWPLYAEQQPNAFELVCELKVAVEISLDYRHESEAGSNTVLGADKIERGITSVLEKNGEIRKRVKEMSEKSRKTMEEGGCSYSHLGRFIDYIMDRV